MDGGRTQSLRMNYLSLVLKIKGCQSRFVGATGKKKTPNVLNDVSWFLTGLFILADNILRIEIEADGNFSIFDRRTGDLFLDKK